MATTCYEEQSREVTADFSCSFVNENHIAPAAVKIENRCTGADYFLWTFEGGMPATSGNKQPGTVHFAEAGTYTITLAAWNLEQRKEISRTVAIDSVMALHFEVVFTDGDTVPSLVQVLNHSAGAASCTWHFPGAVPATQQGRHPLPVLYSEGGTYEISLTAATEHTEKQSSQTIYLHPRLQAGFAVAPEAGCFDYQVPFTATLENRSVSAARFRWTCAGATFSDAEAEHPQLYITTPGTYTLTLEAANSKETQASSQTIVVHPNTNLYAFPDLKFGILRAEERLGCAFSARERGIVKPSELPNVNGEDIDLVFLGLNAGFSLCRFISPDSAALYTLTAIPSARHTVVINKPEAQAAPAMSVTEFDAMPDDALLRQLDIAAHDSGQAFFTKEEGARIVLFETEDGRRGAIKVSAFVSDGDDSYISCTIKIQKQALR
jgi:PKD repeat protein